MNATPLLQTLRSGKRVGMLFTGGSARCAFQIGVAECLFELGIRPTFLVGISGGSWNAAAYAVGNVRRLRHYWRYFSRAPHVDLKNLLRERTPFIYSKVHARAFERYVGGRRLHHPDTIPLYVGVTRLRDRKSMLLNVREHADPLPVFLASNYLPPFYTRPIEIDGESYGDGGLSNNLPYEEMLGLGAETVVIVSVNGETAGGLFRNPGDVDHVIPEEYAERVLTIRPRHRLPIFFIEWRWDRLQATMDLGYLRARELLLGEKHPVTDIRGRSLEPVRSTLRFARELRAAAMRLPSLVRRAR